MSLLPRIRPKVALYAQPLDLMPGQPVELRVRVDAPRPRKVERVDLWIEQRVRAQGRVASIFRHHAQLSARRTFPVGVTELVARAVVPATALPDYAGRRVGVWTFVQVALQTRWRFDVERSFQLRVRGAAEPSRAQPLIFSSRAPGRPDPHLEGSLDRSVLRPGGMLTGRVAAIGAECRKLQVHLVATEHDGAGSFAGPRWTLELDGPLAEGEAVPFAMSIPERVTPSFRAGSIGLSWAVVLQADRAFARDLDLRIPVEVALDTGAPEALSDAPIVGNERVAALWQRLAVQERARFDGGALRDRVGEVELALTARAGRLEARLSFPSLGIGLEGGERDGLRRLTGALSDRGKVPGLGERWNERFYALSRDPAQAQAFSRRALGQLVAVHFRAASDRELQLGIEAQRDDGAAIERLLRLARRVAERVPEAAAAMPMPFDLGPHREAWARAAEAQRARFEPGPPRLVAQSGAWVIETRWDDEDAPRTALVWRATTPIDARLLVAPGGPLPDALSRDARPIAEALAAEGALRIASEEVTLEREGIVADPQDLEGTLERLGRLVRLLRIDEGPYR